MNIKKLILEYDNLSAVADDIVSRVNWEPRVGIIGAYIGDGTRKCISKNIAAAEKYAIALSNLQIKFFCAHLHTRNFERKATAPDEFYYEMDFLHLRQMNAMLVVPGWENSIGTKREIVWADSRGLPIFFPRDPSDMLELMIWFRREERELRIEKF